MKKKYRERDEGRVERKKQAGSVLRRTGTNGAGVAAGTPRG